MKLKEIKTISKFSLFLLSITVLSGLSVLSMVGCKKTESAVNSDNEIKFSVGGMPNTKTAFSRTDSYQLVWITGDQVSIFCDQSIDSENQKTKADYDVTPDSTDPDLYAPSRKNGKLNLASTENKQGLRWGNAATPHNLYAVYPSIDKSGGNVIKETGKEGVFTFNFPKTQTCSTDGSYWSGDNRMLKPNMYLAYMVAKQEGLTPTGNGVLLRFKPIATTLEITLQGTAQSDLVISGIDVNVNVKSINENLVKESDAKDSYQIQFTAKANGNGNDFYSDVSKALTAYQSGVNTATFNIGLSDGNYTLESGKSVTFTVFLPPIKSLDDVEVKCLNADGKVLGTKQLFINNKFASSASKSFFTLPKLNNLVVTIDKDFIKYPETAQATATMYHPDGTSEVVTPSCSWSSGTTDPIVDETGKIWAFGYGSKTIQATYTKNSVTYTATRNINIGTYRTFETSEYMPWAQAVASSNPPAYSKSDMDTHLAKLNVSFWDAEGPAYTFGSGFFIVNNGMIVASYSGTVHTEGRWILKYIKPAGTAQSLAEARTNGDYIFLPACGCYVGTGGSLMFAGTAAYHWLPDPTSTYTRYCFIFGDISAHVGIADAINHYVPMPKLE